MICLRSFKTGTSIYANDVGLPYPPLPERSLLLCDALIPSLCLNTFETDGEALHMNFPGHIAGDPVQVLIDTGASHNFIDTQYANAHRLVIQAEHGTVKCGGNSQTSVIGHSVVWLYLKKGYCQQVKLYVTDLPTGHPDIFGNT